MSKKRKVLPKKPDGVLVVKGDDKTIKAFDEKRFVFSLFRGEYPFFYEDNPCNPKSRALHLTGKKKKLFVNEQFLLNLSREFWEIKKNHSS
jgi:hypothetical protein